MVVDGCVLFMNEIEAYNGVGSDRLTVFFAYPLFLAYLYTLRIKKGLLTKRYSIMYLIYFLIHNMSNTSSNIITAD